MIAMAGSICVCNECVDLLYDIAQKKEREDPARIRKRESKLEELNRIHANLSALRADVNRRLDWMESQIKLLTQVEYENRKPGNARRVAMKAYIRIDDARGVAVRTILP